MTMFSGLLAAALIFAIHAWSAAITGGLLWFSALYVLRLMAKADPQMRPVYLRHRRYKRYYAARSTPWRVNRRGY